MNPIKLIVEIIIAVIFAYLFFEIFITFAQALWTLNPITSIGFIIVVILAFLKGEFSFDKFEDNVGILITIFGGTLASYATSYAAKAMTDSALGLIPGAWQDILAGNFIGALVIVGVIAIIWFKAEEIKDLKFS